MKRSHLALVSFVAALLLTVPAVANTEGTARSADGTPIHYLVDGAGEPALVFIHCWSCDATYWDNQVPAFAAKHRVVRVDLAGHGSSGQQRTRYTLPAFGEDVKAVVEQEKLGKVILVGHSMGGDVMLEAARLLPGKVLGLIAIDTLNDASEKIDPKLLAEWQAAMEKDFPGFTKGFVRGMIPKDTDPALVEKIASDMASAPPAVARSAFAELFAYDEAAGFRAAGAPILGINGTHFPTNVAGNNRFAPYDVTYQPKVGHFGMLEAPAEFNRLLAAAVERIERGGTIMRTLRKEVEVKASLQDVWWAWTTVDGVKTFFAPDARIELRPGGAYEMYFGPDQPVGQKGGEGCRVLSLLPMEMVSFEWNFPPSIPSLRTSGARTWVVIQLTETAPGTVHVRLSQLGWQPGKDWDKGFTYFDHAWGVVLQRLQRRFASGPLDWKTE
ncbi:MAG TPA: alpha/beta fold hydrolase [Thermoanaerobaculaceae bacterium]|nr:alpha/beta fold hydrolase [Thermoanaerobaculaceae bacterium]HPS77921.1 alpha/beta fold hydrolase [Thermoanaerobaculaceae bacterium]